MEKSENDTSKITSRDAVTSAPAATGAISTEFPRDNEQLKVKYDEMHAQGVTSWFSDGRKERETILKLGEPWKGLRVLEIGCGEGDLISLMEPRGAACVGLDYSQEAIDKARVKWPKYPFLCKSYREIKDTRFDRLVLQGVLEHLDNPFGELQWMIEHFKPNTVITSSPCFLNPRGIVWMTLHMLGAVMSKTDLHFLHPWQFDEFCREHGYRLKMQDCDKSWGNGSGMIEDFQKRIPLALRDGNLKPCFDVANFLGWLKRCNSTGYGATMVYRIDL